MVQVPCLKCQERHPENFYDCPNAAREDQLTIFDYSKDAMLEMGFLDSPKKSMLFELMQCPIDWKEFFQDSGIGDALKRYLIEIACECVNEIAQDYLDPTANVIGYSGMDFGSQTYEEIMNKIFLDSFPTYFEIVPWMLLDDETIAKQSPYLEEWIEKSKREYCKRVSRFMLRLLSTNEQSKHFEIFKMTNEEIRERTRTGKKVSLFYRGITPEIIEKLLPGALEGSWRLLLNLPYENLYIDSLVEIGASRGETTSFICIKLDLKHSIRTRISHFGKRYP